jgi:hypothetical protein
MKEPPMRRSKFTEEQIALTLGQAETGMPVEDTCEKLGSIELGLARIVGFHAYAVPQGKRTANSVRLPALTRGVSA